MQNLKLITDEKIYRTWKGADWPSYDDFVNQNYIVSDTIQKEIENFIDVISKKYKDLTEARTEELSIANQKRQGQIFFNKKYKGNTYCRIPWDTIGINANGNVYICQSPSWVPIFVGNILETNDIFEILNSEIARKIRFQILNKTYHYCNSTICSYFQKIDKNRYETFPTNKEDLVKKDFVDSPELYLANIPKEIIFDFDYTCNLKCPSCRTENINWNNDYVIRPTNNKIVKKIKELIIDKIDNSLTTIRWCGGEPFMSEVYLDLLDYISNSNKTNIQNVIQTNGSLFQAKEKLVLKLLPYISTLRISYDAGCEETYKLTRVGGDWKRLLENTNFVLTLIKDNNFRTSVQADFVVQKNNYKDIPEFISICKNFNITPNLQKMWNWGTWDDEIFEEQNIYNVNHSLYNNLKQIFEIVNIPIAKN